MSTVTQSVRLWQPLKASIKAAQMRPRTCFLSKCAALLSLGGSSNREYLGIRALNCLGRQVANIPWKRARAEVRVQGTPQTRHWHPKQTLVPTGLPTRGSSGSTTASSKARSVALVMHNRSIAGFPRKTVTPGRNARPLRVKLYEAFGPCEGRFKMEIQEYSRWGLVLRPSDSQPYTG